MPSFGAAHAAQNKGTANLYWFSYLSKELRPTQNCRIQGLFKLLSDFPVLFKADLIFKYLSRKPSIFKYFSSLCEPWWLRNYYFIFINSFTWQCGSSWLIRIPRFAMQLFNISSGCIQAISSSELLAKLELEDLNLILRERRLRWFGHVERSSGAVRTACDIQIDGRRGQGGQS